MAHRRVGVRSDSQLPFLTRVQRLSAKKEGEEKELNLALHQIWHHPDGSASIIIKSPKPSFVTHKHSSNSARTHKQSTDYHGLHNALRPLSLRQQHPCPGTPPQDICRPCPTGAAPQLCRACGELLFLHYALTAPNLEWPGPLAFIRGDHPQGHPLL